MKFVKLDLDLRKLEILNFDLGKLEFDFRKFENCILMREIGKNEF